MSCNVTHNLGDFIACPRCGTYSIELWEHGWTDAEDEGRVTECGGCEKSFLLKRYISVRYTAEVP